METTSGRNRMTSFKRALSITLAVLAVAGLSTGWVLYLFQKPQPHETELPVAEMIALYETLRESEEDALYISAWECALKTAFVAYEETEFDQENEALRLQLEASIYDLFNDGMLSATGFYLHYEDLFSDWERFCNKYDSFDTHDKHGPAAIAE